MNTSVASILLLLMNPELMRTYSETDSIGSCSLIKAAPQSQLDETVLELQKCQAVQVRSNYSSIRNNFRRSSPPCLDQLPDNCRREIHLSVDTHQFPCNDSWEAHLKYHFSFANKTHYMITLEWDSYPGTKSYSVVAVLFETSASGGCTVETNLTSVNFKLRYEGYFTSNIAVKVAPAGTCVASRELIIERPPENCFYLCSLCSCLDYQSLVQLYGPKVTETCISDENGSSTSLRITWTWEKGQEYLMSHSNLTFHLSISRGEMELLHMEVIGQTSAYLQLRGLDKTKSYKVEVTEIICMEKVRGETKLISFNNCPATPTTLPSKNFSSNSETSSIHYMATSHSTGTIWMNDYGATPTATPTSSVKQQYSRRLPASNTDSNSDYHHKATSGIIHSQLSSTMPIAEASSSISPSQTSEATINIYNSSSSVTSSDAHLTTYTNIYYHTPWIAVLIVVTVAAFSIFLVTVFTTLRKYHFHLKKEHHDKAVMTEEGAEKTVLVLFSQASSIKDELSVMEHVVKALSVYGVNCLYFDKPSVRTSVAEWVEGSIKRSDKVLLVVNKEFVMEWDSPKAYLPHGESLVYVARQVVHSFVMRDKQQLSKFALVYLRKEDQRDLLKDSLYLQSVKSYLVQPQALGELEGLVRFILDVPTYVLPITASNM